MRKYNANQGRIIEMNHKGMMYFTFVLLVGLISLWGCPKKAEVASSPELQKENVMAPATPTPEAKSAAAEPGMKHEGQRENAGAMAEGLKPIYFDFDKSFLRDDAKAVLHANAEWLKAHPEAKVMIEGNCDERGTKEYNQALGQRRAVSAKKYLADMGIMASRISLISYGKEKLICNEPDETCWQRNRKDDFVVMAK
jgi:peptidoglycan-associated lipoprotein